MKAFGLALVLALSAGALLTQAAVAHPIHGRMVPHRPHHPIRGRVVHHPMGIHGKMVHGKIIHHGKLIRHHP
jgi:hypothetical protein